MSTDHTKKCWPDETPEDLIEAARARGGDAEAALVAKALGLPPAPRKKQVPEVVGNKERTPAAPSGIGPQGPAWEHPDFVRVTPGNRSGMPNSGAGPVVKLVPRAHARRRGLNDS